MRLIWPLLLLLAACNTSRTVEKDGAGRALLDEAIGVLSTQPLGHERVDWSAVQRELEAAIPIGAPASAAHAAIEVAVARLNDTHARFEPPPAAVSSPAAQPASGKRSTSSANPPIPKLPEGQILDGDIAYLLVPGCSASTPDDLRDYALVLRETVLQLESKQPLGWILDLRLNGGGNVWPMLLGLEPLLGDGEQLRSIAPEGVHRLGCDAQHAWLSLPGSAQPFEQLRIEAPANNARVRSVPVALLTGAWTMSSGEMIVLAFSGRPNARRFGEPTAGMTTATNDFPLADGSKLNLPVAWQADRSGWAPRGPIAPDVAVDNGAWPASDDATSGRAQAWMR